MTPGRAPPSSDFSAIFRLQSGLVATSGGYSLKLDCFLDFSLEKLEIFYTIQLEKL